MEILGQSPTLLVTVTAYGCGLSFPTEALPGDQSCVPDFFQSPEKFGSGAGGFLPLVLSRGLPCLSAYSTPA